MSQWTFLLSFLFLWYFAEEVGTYPSGAPPSTCEDMVPRHLKYTPQTNASPYFIQPATLNVKSGDRLKVMLSSQENLDFLGFMVQAKLPSGVGDPLGKFSNLPEVVKAITCGSNALVRCCLQMTLFSSIYFL